MPTTSVSVVRAGCLLIGMLASVGCDIILGIEPPRARVAVDGSGGDGGNPSGQEGGSPTAEAGSDPGVHAGQAGTTSGGMAGGATGGSHGGTVATGGSGGSDPPPELTIDVGDLPVACSGQGVTVQLTADGGTAPYTWSLLEPASGFELRGDGNTATLSGTAEAAGVQILHVVVTDDEGLPTEREVELTTHQTPVIESLTLPSVCPNEIYRAELVASGGNEANYEWTTTLPEDTGLRVTSNFLEGKLTREPDDARRIDFTATVDDGQCSASTPATLQLDAPTARACPSVNVQSSLDNEPPPPCLGYEYGARLFVERGSPAFKWRAKVVPPGMSFDPETQSVSGMARGDGDLTVEVTDGQQRTIEQTYRLVPRTECWLAYITRTNSSSRLRLFDPILENQRNLPAGDGAEPVLDFKFSADGEFLAYRLGASPAVAQLVIVQLDTWHEQAVPAQGVSYYAWSDDSSALAYAATNSEGGYLGGLVRPETTGAPMSSVQPENEFQPLLPIPTPVDFEPTWVGNGQVAFMTLDLEADLVLTTATRGPEGFTRVDIWDADFYPPNSVQLRSHEHGLFIIPQAGHIRYFADDGSDPLAHSKVALSPSGRYAVRVQAGADQSNALAVFRAAIDTSRLQSDPPHLLIENCEFLLTWATARERFACARKNAAPNELMVFELDPVTNELKVPLEVRGNFLYPEEAHSQRRRLFSPSGARLALAADETLIVASFHTDASLQVGLAATESVKLKPDLISSDSKFAELHFSPDESMLLQRRGNRFSLFAADHLIAGGEHIISEEMATSVRCEEDFQARDGGWCGGQRSDVPFVWSADSKWIAYEITDGTVKLYDVSRRASKTYLSIVLDEVCGPGCVFDDQFQFQPATKHEAN